MPTGGTLHEREIRFLFGHDTKKIADAKEHFEVRIGSKRSFSNLGKTMSRAISTFLVSEAKIDAINEDTFAIISRGGKSMPSTIESIETAGMEPIINEKPEGTIPFFVERWIETNKDDRKTIETAVPSIIDGWNEWESATPLMKACYNLRPDLSATYFIKRMERGKGIPGEFMDTLITYATDRAEKIYKGFVNISVPNIRKMTWHILDYVNDIADEEPFFSIPLLPIWDDIKRQLVTRSVYDAEQLEGNERKKIYKKLLLNDFEGVRRAVSNSLLQRLSFPEFRKHRFEETCDILRFEIKYEKKAPLRRYVEEFYSKAGC